MAATVEFLLGQIRANDGESISRQAEARSLMGRRNAGLIWAALIDQSAKDFDTRRPGDCLSAMKALAKERLALNEPLENGETPFGMMLARSPGLASLAIGEVSFDLNALDRSGITPAQKCVSLAARAPMDYFMAIAKMAAQPEWKIEAKDQGAAACFAVAGKFPYFAASARDGEARAVAGLIFEALAAKGYDFNAAREAGDAKMGSAINTPLAYCVKKAARWSCSGRADKAVMGSIEAIVAMLIERGADPGLQMEPGERFHLLEACRASGLGSGLAASLEAGVLGVCIGGDGGAGKSARHRL